MIISTLFSQLYTSSFVLVSQFGGNGLQPPTENSVFAPTDLGETTILRSVNNSLSFIITALTGLAAVFFLFQFVIGAFNWVNAGGEQKKVQEARDRITQGVMGLVLIVGAYAIVGLIGTVLGIEILNPGKFIQDDLLR